MVFNVKMEDFKRKAPLVAGGHKTKAPATITYASVVSQETVRIALMLAALNDLQVKVGDVLNAYITAPVKEKVWTILGPEFGSNAGRSPSLYAPCMDLKVLVQHFVLTLLRLCTKWDTHPVRLTPTYGLKPRPDQTTMYGTMLTSCVMWTTSCVYITMPCLS
jgi:hypothetical protein